MASGYNEEIFENGTGYQKREIQKIRLLR